MLLEFILPTRSYYFNLSSRVLIRFDRRMNSRVIRRYINRVEWLIGTKEMVA